MHAPSTHVVLLGALGLLAAAGAARAQDDSANAAQSCIAAKGIDHTTILDDRNILFFMRKDHAAYRNTLLRACPGLRAENHFTYAQDALSGLCRGNVINVLSYTFDSPTLGASCQLGTFAPVTDDEVEELIAAATPTRKNRDAGRPAIKVEPVELPAAAPRPAPAEASTPPPPPAQPAPAEAAR